MNNTIDPIEIQKFSKIADQWWNPNGDFKILHKFNPIRLRYVIEQISKIKQLDNNKELKNLTILDIGCGGGLISEPLSNLGAEVLAIDPIEKNIMIAKSHQLISKSSVNYVCTTVEKLKQHQKFDVILCLEVIEHVANPELLLTQLSNLLKDKGILFISTINRTIKSLILAKFTAEYILQWIPKTTHNWKKFLKPSEVNSYIKDKTLQLNNISGFNYNIFNNRWDIDNNLSQNYIMCYSKISSH